MWSIATQNLAPSISSNLSEPNWRWKWENFRNACGDRESRHLGQKQGKFTRKGSIDSSICTRSKMCIGSWKCLMSWELSTNIWDIEFKGWRNFFSGSKNSNKVWAIKIKFTSNDSGCKIVILQGKINKNLMSIFKRSNRQIISPYPHTYSLKTQRKNTQTLAIKEPFNNFRVKMYKTNLIGKMKITSALGLKIIILTKMTKLTSKISKILLQEINPYQLRVTQYRIGAPKMPLQSRSKIQNKRPKSYSRLLRGEKKNQWLWKILSTTWLICFNKQQRSQKL